MIRKSIHSPRDVYKAVEPVLRSSQNHKRRVLFDGDMIKGNSQRYLVFFYKGMTCVSCGMEGKYFAKEKSSGSIKESYHLNLYAINENGKEVLMTKDHIIPKSKGGKDLLSNYQCMCEKCNSAKGNKFGRKRRKG